MTGLSPIQGTILDQPLADSVFFYEASLSAQEIRIYRGFNTISILSKI
ncbi:protein of unknown function [Candidatus Filomicrobium marinum]|uniref:Uncharacterized protein n=1 Tax=Candidatus Filomicrobium marinum TaxID=1608628 RepID=A0A0D6JCQ8_9HYPH|nr:protein of unknown function [Candidatus Filomicrobium marinum]CPR17340.1 protein of unknown function [Candidatus Filomicrobium marinum]